MILLDIRLINYGKCFDDEEFINNLNKKNTDRLLEFDSDTSCTALINMIEEEDNINHIIIRGIVRDDNVNLVAICNGVLGIYNILKTLLLKIEKIDKLIINIDELENVNHGITRKMIKVLLDTTIYKLIKDYI